MRFTAPGGLHVQGERKHSTLSVHFRHCRAVPWTGVSAEEILRDRSLLKRERFLQVKWHHYVHAKLTVVAAVSLFHALGFVVVSHLILDIPGFFLKHTSCCLPSHCLAMWWVGHFCHVPPPRSSTSHPLVGHSANHLRRRHHSLNASLAFTQEDAVPWFGNIMASRWGFEALAGCHEQPLCHLWWCGKTAFTRQHGEGFLASELKRTKDADSSWRN